MPPVYLWLDDERPAPSGWTHARSVAEAIEVLERGPVEAASLDHDLGDVDAANAGNPGHTPRERTGYHLLLWMAEHGRWPRQKPLVHSANPVGRAAMVQFIDRHWRAPEET
ncbi:MAG: hypothetical protein EOO70_07910 [Myxococcaceae bacterium]|nr:MAG: hypothetical protein EOO70_07910 [Myxococcaceae bacterium]